MSEHTFEETRAGYLGMWTRAKLLPGEHDKALAIARKIGDTVHGSAFRSVEGLTGVPWFVVGCLLERESSGNLGTYLGNGEKLSEVTSLVPAGRGPFTGPTAFLDGAVDALKHEGMTGITDWSIERILYWCERFNGQGYFGRCNSPYLWSWTDQYTSGKFVDEKPGVKAHFDPNHVDEQPGVVALLKALAEIYPDIAKAIATPSLPPAPAPITQETTMPTAPATTAVPVQMTDPIPQIIAMLNVAQGVLSKLAMLIPAPYGAIAQDAIPIIEEALQLIEDFKSKSGTDLFQAIGSRVQAIGQHFQTVGQGVQTAATPTSNTSGMPNS